MQTMRLVLFIVCCVLSLQLFSQHNEIEKLLREKKYRDAYLLADKELLETPNNPKLNLLKWRASYWGNIDLLNNFKFLNKAIDLDTVYSEAYRERGGFLLNLLRFEAAKDDIDAALKYADTDSAVMEAKMLLASYYQYVRNYELSIKISLEVLQYDSLNLMTLNNLALGYQDIGQFEKALEVLYKIEKINPNVVYAVINIGYVLSKMEQYEKAVTYFDKAEKINKNEPLVYSNRAFSKYKLTQYSEAMKDINKSIKLFPSNSYAYCIRAQIHMAAGNTDKACEDLRQALAYKYTEVYGDEAKNLRDKYCIR